MSGNENSNNNFRHNPMASPGNLTPGAGAIGQQEALAGSQVPGLNQGDVTNNPPHATAIQLQPQQAYRIAPETRATAHTYTPGPQGPMIGEVAPQHGGRGLIPGAGPNMQPGDDSGFDIRQLIQQEFQSQIRQHVQQQVREQLQSYGVGGMAAAATAYPGPQFPLGPQSFANMASNPMGLSSDPMGFPGMVAGPDPLGLRNMMAGPRALAENTMEMSMAFSDPGSHMSWHGQTPFSRHPYYQGAGYGRIPPAPGMPTPDSLAGWPTALSSFGANSAGSSFRVPSSPDLTGVSFGTPALPNPLGGPALQAAPLAAAGENLLPETLPVSGQQDWVGLTAAEAAWIGLPVSGSTIREATPAMAAAPTHGYHHHQPAAPTHGYHREPAAPTHGYHHQPAAAPTHGYHREAVTQAPIARPGQLPMLHSRNLAHHNSMLPPRTIGDINFWDGQGETRAGPSALPRLLPAPAHRNYRERDRGQPAPRQRSSSPPPAGHGSGGGGNRTFLRAPAAPLPGADRATYLDRFEAGLCIDCGGSLEASTTTNYCGPCKRSRVAKQHQRTRRSRGEASRGGDEPGSSSSLPDPAAARALPPSTRHPNVDKATYLARWEAGRCVDCGGAPQPADATLCDTCRQGRRRLTWRAKNNRARRGLAAADGRRDPTGLLGPAPAVEDRALPTAQTANSRYPAGPEGVDAATYWYRIDRNLCIVCAAPAKGKYSAYCTACAAQARKRVQSDYYNKNKPGRDGDADNVA